MISGKTIFIAPLDWGLGHATRCVPLIRDLEKSNKVLLGVTPLTKAVFEVEFPHLLTLDLPAYNVRYSKRLPLWLKLFLSWPRIVQIIRAEKLCVAKIVDDYKVDLVISDNRFGLFSEKIHSVFITHQVFLRTPFAAAIAQRRNKRYIKKFDEVWIPDYEKETDCLSGELSHGYHFHPRVKYIGPKTRLQKILTQEKKYDYLFLLSGPEPQQSILRNLLIKKAKQYPGLKFALVIHSALKKDGIDHIELFISPDATTLSHIIACSEKVICRSGYSTLMDLYLLGKEKLVLIPTPGQTEQEYLAHYWKQKFNAEVVAQSDIDRLKI